MTDGGVGEPELASYLAFAERLADAARTVTLKHYRQGIGFEAKDDHSPVTAADRESESVMRAMIKDAYPEHGVVGEEEAATLPDAEFVWVLDPVDGTRSFAIGKATYGVLVGLEHHGRPIIGVIDEPPLSTRWCGVRGRPTTYNGAPARVRDCTGVANAWLTATSPQMFREGIEFERYENLRRRCGQVVYGGECLGYGFLACGWVDLVVEATLGQYDYSALVPVVEGAGGIITDWAGAPLTGASDGTVVAAANAELHAEALALLAA